MAAYEDSVEREIVERIEVRLQAMQARQSGEISNEALKREQTRLFDGENGNPDNTNFFPVAMRQSLNVRINTAREDIVAVESPEFYTRHNFETAKPRGEMKQLLLQEIENIFVDPDTHILKLSYINAFGGMDAVNTLFAGEGFTDVNGNRLPATATPQDKLKSVLINAYYNQYNQELYAKTTALPNLLQKLEMEPELNVTIRLWEGKPLDMVKEMDARAYAAYKERRHHMEEVDEIPQIASLDDLLGHDEAPLTLEQEPRPALADLMNEADDIHTSLGRTPKYWSAAQANNATLFQPGGCSNSTHQNNALPEAISTPAPDNNCRIS